MKKVLIAMILVMLTGFTYSQNYKLVFSNGELYQESNNKWLSINIDKDLTATKYKLEGDDAYVIVSNLGGELRRINSELFTIDDIKIIFNKNDNLSLDYISLIYKKFTSKKKKEENTAIGAISRGVKPFIRPFDNGVLIEQCSYLNWKKGVVNRFYLKLYSDDILVLDTTVNGNKINIEKYTNKMYSNFKWFVSDEYIDDSKIFNSDDFYSFSIKEDKDDLLNALEQIKSIKNHKERLYFESLILETNSYYDLAFKQLQELVILDYSMQYLLDNFLERR